MTTTTKNLIEMFEMVNIPQDISSKEIEDFLSQKNIRFTKIDIVKSGDKTRNARVQIPNDALLFTQIEILKGQHFPKHTKDEIMIYFVNTGTNDIVIPKPKPLETVSFDYQYERILQNEFERKKGDDGIVFTNKTVLDKQRSVAGYLIKQIGLNIIKGRSIMNISLPINIFDKRTLLELWVGQNGYAATLLETAGALNDPLERIKYTTCFALAKFHLSAAQLKPFNPILGETYQSIIKDSHFYLEQTCHHPPITNFYGFGKNYKIYGYNESEASTGANSVKVMYKGKIYAEFPDGSRHFIIYPTLKLEGTMMGERKLKYRGKLVVFDAKNDLMALIKLDPDKRTFIEKMSKEKQTYPDYYKGVITSHKNNIDMNFNGYTLIKPDQYIYSTIEGEFSKYCSFDKKTYWETSDQFPTITRQQYTLPSDSCLREDVWLWKQDKEDLAQNYKVRLEDNQRRDEKLRETYQKSKPKTKK